MHKLSQLPADLAERLEIPGEALPGTGRLTISGGRQAVVEGHRGVLDFTENRLVLRLGREKLILEGTGLRLRALNGDELLVAGRIRSVEWG